MTKDIFEINNIKRFLKVSFGTLILALALHFFLIPTKLVAGGASGLALLISTATHIQMSIIYFLLNLFLIILGIIILGMSFGLLTIYSSLLCSGYLFILEEAYPMTHPFVDDLLINLLFGVFFGSMGTFLVLNSGASTGGTDIVGKIFEKYTAFSFGNGLMLCDGLITLGAIFLYGPTIGMYCIFGVFLNSSMIDRFIAGFNIKYNVSIVSKRLDEINGFILNELGRGSTIYHAQGGFSNDDKKILTSVLDKKQYLQLKAFVKSIDQEAFFYVYTVSEIEGEGFTY